jgi:4-hydroxy-3-methylbut-2-enyl diphosphate reductase
MAVDRVLLAEPRGFCAGVQMAIKGLTWMVRLFEPPVYCYHEIVHNKVVVERFRELGVIFVDDLEEVPPGSPLMLSAHGTAPEIVTSAQARGCVVVNAVCPLVTKVHQEVKVRAKRGFSIIYVGHAGHDEALGTTAVAPEAVHLVEDEADVAALPGLEGPIALIAQTTLSLDEWAGVREAVLARFPEVWMPGRSDLCFATTNRQTALKAVAAEAGTVVVIGSDNSSNTVALGKVALRAGAARVIRVNTADELPDDLTGTVALTAGASAPEELVAEVLERLAPAAGVEEVHVVEEVEYFPPPPELRALLRVLATAAGTFFGCEPAARHPASDDRDLEAATVLGELVGQRAAG